MDLYQLRVVRELGDQGSVAATAAALGVSGPAVSQVLATLQRDFSVPLTRRAGRTVELTDAGRALAAASVRVATAFAEAESAVEDFVGDASRTVRVSAFHSAAINFFPAMTAQVGRTDFPDLECVDEDVEVESFPALTARYDIVIAHRMSHSRPWPEDRLAVVPLLAEPMDVAMHRSHPLARLTSLRPGDLAGATWVSTHRGFSPADMLDAVGAAAGAPLTVVHRINDFATAAAIVAQGDHLALLPRHTTSLDAVPEIVLRPLTGMSTVRRIDALMRPELSRHRAIRIVCTVLQEIARERVAGFATRRAS